MVEVAGAGSRTAAFLKDPAFVIADVLPAAGFMADRAAGIANVGTMILTGPFPRLAVAVTDDDLIELREDTAGPVCDINAIVGEVASVVGKAVDELPSGAIRLALSVLSLPRLASCGSLFFCFISLLVVTCHVSISYACVMQPEV